MKIIAKRNVCDPYMAELYITYEGTERPRHLMAAVHIDMLEDIIETDTFEEAIFELSIVERCEVEE